MTDDYDIPYICPTCYGFAHPDDERVDIRGVTNVDEPFAHEDCVDGDADIIADSVPNTDSEYDDTEPHPLEEVGGTRRGQG